MTQTQGRLSTTTASEQYEKGLQAGRDDLAKGLNADAIERRLKFLRNRIPTASPTLAAFFQGRLDALQGK